MGSWGSVVPPAASGEVAKDFVNFVESCEPKPAAVLGTIDIDPTGHLARRSAERPLEFTFQYRGVLFAGQAQSSLEESRLRIHANLGSLPYTMESSFKRATALAIVRAASRTLGGRVRLTDKQGILLLDEKQFREPLTPRDLMANTVRMVLEVRPFLELLSMVVDPPTTRLPRVAG